MSKTQMLLEGFFEKGERPVIRQQKTLRLPTKRKLHLKENTKSPSYIMSSLQQVIHILQARFV